MAKDKKAKLIKRIYEQGRETTVTSKHKAFVAHRQENELLHKKRVKGPSATSREVQAKQKKVEAKTQVVAPRPFVDAYDLPSYPEKSRFVLLVKDPSWIFAYWEISPKQIESVKNTLSDYDRTNVRVVLRMYDITLVDFNGYNANHWFDIEVGPNASNWYINLWHDNVSYVGDIGLKMPSGNFITLVRSNVVHTPRRGYSPRTEQIWMKFEDAGQPIPYIVPQLKSKAEKTHPKMPEEYKRQGKEFYLTEDDIRQYYSRINPFLRDIISSRLIGLYGKKAGRYGFIIEGDTEEERQRLLSWLPKGAFLKRLKIGASEELVMFGGGSEFVLKGA